jgi:hypothetical protein
MEIAHHVEVTACTGATERLIVTRVKRDAILMKIAHHVQVAISTCAREWLVVTGVQLDAILMEIPDDAQATILSRPTERLIIAHVQLGATLMKPPDCIHVAPARRLANGLIERPLFGALSRLRARNAPQQLTPGNLFKPMCRYASHL